MSAKVRGEARADMPSAPHQSHGEQREAPRTIILSLPLPSPLLTPNTRMHWGERARHVKAQRYDARLLTYCQLPEVVEPLRPGARLRLDVEVRPRPRMKRLDDDNLWSALKSYRDGIADALLMDDKRFVIGELTWSDTRSGEILLTLTEAQP